MRFVSVMVPLDTTADPTLRSTLPLEKPAVVAAAGGGAFGAAGTAAKRDEPVRLISPCVCLPRPPPVEELELSSLRVMIGISCLDCRMANCSRSLSSEMPLCCEDPGPPAPPPGPFPPPALVLAACAKDPHPEAGAAGVPTWLDA